MPFFEENKQAAHLQQMG